MEKIRLPPVAEPVMFMFRYNSTTVSLTFVSDNFGESQKHQKNGYVIIIVAG